ncbi:hypothetical protein GJ744_001602 [Endocarpon pusillum]|uniref:Kelch repeat protein n=1 Tax=Endocarpon pusillum TaxID=364733 RepID=A0A8H7E371_9EURO|nr:hypothetical protein GJ744_001602 [Endocarpon pusillum]
MSRYGQIPQTPRSMHGAGRSTKPCLVPQNSLWKFTPSSGGSGSWSEQSMPSNSIFPSLTRPAGSISAYGSGIGYVLGGYETAWTTPQTAGLTALVPTPGMVSYNSDTGTWKNESAIGYTTFGTAMFGQMQFVPHVGQEGLLVVLGGATSDVIQWEDRGTNYISFENINMFNPATSTWHNQTASGTTPNSRLRFCSVGVPGDNGTYEIFIYGGHIASAGGETQASDTTAQQQRNIELDEVFVLSLPGFVWMKADYTAANPRISHACNVAQRQMIITGGLNPASRNMTDLYSSQDVWNHGIGVFDLTAMQWKDNYDANAEPYITPNVVKSWYATNGPYPSTWNDSAVEGFFTQPPSSLETDANSDPSPPKDGSASNKPDASVIAGGVVGGVVGLALVATLFWLYRRYRSHRRNAHSTSTEGEFVKPKAELGDNPLSTKNTHITEDLSELDGPGAGSSEVPRNVPRHEMPSYSVN